MAKRYGFLDEQVADYRYLSPSQILMPSSKILIGTAGKMDDAVVFESADLTFDFGLGVAENGLDTGTETSNQWYALYAVPKAGTKQYQLRASISAPHIAGGSGPTGFSKYRYLGLFRNGVNTYNSLADHNPNDICMFVKDKNAMQFHGFNTTNGGNFPKAQTQTGITLFVANTTLNSVMFDAGTSTYIGFSGNSPQGAAKLPYKRGLYKFAHYINSSTGSAAVLIRDSSSNDRIYVPMVVEGLTNTFHIRFEHQFSAPYDFQSSIHSAHSANPNVNRGLLLQGFVDPYTVGGI